MSVASTRTVVRGRPSRARGPARVSKKAGQIWANAPLDCDEQGRVVRICPMFDYIVQASTGLAAGKNVWFRDLVGRIETIVGAGVLFDGADGRLRMASGTTATHGIGFILNGGDAAGSGVNLGGLRQVSGQTMRFGARLKIDVATASSVYFGLQSDASGISSPSRGYWFEWVNGAAPAFKMANANGTQVVGNGGTIVLRDSHGNPAPAATNDTYLDAGFVLEGNEIDIYWDGGKTAIASPTNLFTGDAYLFAAVVTAAAQARTLTIERIGATRTVA